MSEVLGKRTRAGHLGRLCGLDRDSMSVGYQIGTDSSEPYLRFVVTAPTLRPTTSYSVRGRVISFTFGAR